jgi:hypothetical protein
MMEKEALRKKIEAKRSQLEADLSQMRGYALGTAEEHKDRIERKLRQLEVALKDGWEQLSENGARKLDAWLNDD